MISRTDKTRLNFGVISLNIKFSIISSILSYICSEVQSVRFFACLVAIPLLLVTESWFSLFCVVWVLVTPFLPQRWTCEAGLAKQSITCYWSQG